MSTEAVAKVILKEVPVGQLRSVLSHAGGSPSAMGDGCGGGCGGGAGCLDAFGHTGLTNEQIQKAFADKQALSKALGKEIQAAATHF